MYPLRARVLLAAAPLGAALAAALISMAVLLVFGTAPAAAQEQTGGDVVAWGDNAYGQTNVPTVLGSVKAISAGWYHSLAIGGSFPRRRWP